MNCVLQKQEDGWYFCPDCNRHPLPRKLPRNCQAKPGPEPQPNPTQPQKRKLLGDRIEQALTAVGITKERVERVVGRPCGCEKRKEMMNLLHAWVEKKTRGLFRSNEQAQEELEEILE